MTTPKQRRPAEGTAGQKRFAGASVGGDATSTYHPWRLPATTLVLRDVRDEAGRWQGLEVHRIGGAA